MPPTDSPQVSPLSPGARDTIRGEVADPRLRDVLDAAEGA